MTNNNTPEWLKLDEQKDMLRFITAGSVDDGKSTLIGRLLYEANGLYEDQLSAIKQTSQKSQSGKLDLSLATDGLKAERQQGITIDVAYRYFSTPKRKFIIADTPGHEQYTRNMATGASTAQLMVILIDAANGLLTQSKRHAFIASLLGIRHVLIAINKMDLVDYSQKVFEEIRADFTEFSTKLQIQDMTFIPISALEGDNIAIASKNFPWYHGPTFFEYIQTVHVASNRNLIDLRLAVQYVGRDENGKRIYMGTPDSGIIRQGDEIMVLPGGTKNRVKTLYDPDGKIDEAFPPIPCGLELEKEIDLSRGDMIVHPNNLPRIDNKLEAMIIWMSENSMQVGGDYIFKHSAGTVTGNISQIKYKIDVNTLHRQKGETLELNDVARATVELNKPIAFDPYEKNRHTGAFIVIDRISNNTIAAGIILDRKPAETISTPTKWTSQPKSQNIHHHASQITPAIRQEKLGHAPAVVWITGLTGAGKSTVAYSLEKKLFDEGYTCCVLNGENLRLGVNKDLAFDAADRGENVRRAAEIAAMMSDAGLIVICEFLSPFSADREHARESIGSERFIEVHLHAPEDVRRNRDTNGLYALADTGKIKLFPGISAPYEAPQNPEIDLDTQKISVQQCVDNILQTLKDKKIIN